MNKKAIISITFQINQEVEIPSNLLTEAEVDSFLESEHIRIKKSYLPEDLEWIGTQAFDEKQKLLIELQPSF